MLMKLLAVIALATLCLGCGNFQMHREGRDREALAATSDAARRSRAEMCR